MKRIIALASLLTLGLSSAAFAGSFESGVRNRYERRTGTYTVDQKVKFHLDQIQRDMGSYQEVPN